MNEDDQYRVLSGKLVDNTTEPPATLRDKVVEQLIHEKEINATSTRTRTYLIQTVAAAAMFIIGFGTAFVVLQSSPSVGDDYMLLLYDGDQFNPPSPGSLHQEYGQWMQTVQGAEIVAGEELESQGLLVSSAGSALKDRASGFFILRATTSQQVIEIAKTSPHARYGGIVEIKKVIK